ITSLPGCDSVMIDDDDSSDGIFFERGGIGLVMTFVDKLIKCIFLFCVPCLVQAWVVMVFQISLSLDALIVSVSSTFIHSLRLFVLIILCLPLQRFPSILPLMLKLSISLFLITCPKNLIFQKSM